MKIKNILIKLIILITNLTSVKTDWEKYDELKIENINTIEKKDLPEEFSENTFEIIDEFIKKTINLNIECLIYFDYKTGEILKCAIGEINGVKIDFKDNEFDNHHISSIHNHPSSVYSPPSDKNFSILIREFEDYELIASPNELWILKAKGTNPKLNIDFKLHSKWLLNSCQEYCRKRYDNFTKASDMCDVMYGIMLSNYINDKNINNIQLTKKEYQS